MAAPGAVARGVGIGFLVFAVWGMLGFALAVLFKGAPLAIELGLAWALSVEIKRAALPTESDAYERFRRFTLGEHNSGATGHFASPVPEGFGAPEALVEPGRAAITLAFYVALIVLLASFFLWKRDAT